MIPVADILAKVFKKGPTAKKIKEQFLLEAWPDVVGEHIAKKTEAVNLENGTLLIRVTDSVWAQHLALQKKQIITKMNRSQQTRALQDIRFLVGKLQQPNKLTKNNIQNVQWRSVELAEAEMKVISQSFEQWELPSELENSMKKLFIAQKKRQKAEIVAGQPICAVCGLPLVQTAKETYCLRCKTEDSG